MEIPSEEFWFKMGLCIAATGRLKELIECGIGHKEVIDEQIESVNFLWDSLLEICDTVHVEEDIRR